MISSIGIPVQTTAVVRWCMPSIYGCTSTASTDVLIASLHRNARDNTAGNTNSPARHWSLLREANASQHCLQQHQCHGHDILEGSWYYFSKRSNQ